MESTQQTGPASYEVGVRGQIWNRHAEQLRPATEAPREPSGEGSSAESNPHTRPRRNIKEPDRLTYDQLGKPSLSEEKM